MNIQEIRENAPKFATHYNFGCKAAPYERHTKNKKYTWYMGKWDAFHGESAAKKIKDL